MEVINDYEIYFSTCSSSLIHIQDTSTRNKTVIKRDSIKKQEVPSVTWGRKQNEILLGYRDGTVSSYDVDTEQFDRVAKKDGKIVSLFPCGNDIVCATENTVYRDDKIVMKNDDETTFRKAVVNEFDKTVFGCGGVDNDLKLYNLETDKITFTAKGDRHDELNLKQPISISDIVFLDPSSGAQVATVTLQGQVRIYDTRAQRRPVKIFKNPKEPRTYTKISKTHDPMRIIVGTNKGCLQTFDFRKAVKPLQASQAFMGAVVDLSCLGSHIVSCGLDRYWKIHEAELEQVYQEYIKIQVMGFVARLKNWRESEEPTPAKKKKLK